MITKKKKLIDDGFNAELVETAIFDGLFEISIFKQRIKNIFFYYSNKEVLYE